MRLVLTLMAGLIASPALAQGKGRSRCATWARSTSAGGTLKSADSRSRRSYSRPAAFPPRLTRWRRAHRHHLRDQAGRQPGLAQLFLRAGWDTYISDAMERGRSGWTGKFKGEPVFLPLGDPWERFRVGPIGS